MSFILFVTWRFSPEYIEKAMLYTTRFSLNILQAHNGLTLLERNESFSKKPTQDKAATTVFKPKKNQKNYVYNIFQH